MQERRAVPDVSETFQKQFGADPNTVSFAPGRINLIGEHVDYNDGIVLPIALPIGVSVALGRTDKAGLHCYSSLTEEEVFRPFTDTRSGHWSDYPLAAWTVAHCPADAGYQIAVESTLPHGASVSSSAAVLVAVLRAFRAAGDIDLTDREIALRAQQAENGFVGVQCGLMDQMASSVGQPKQALFFDTRSGETRPVDMIHGTSILTLHSGQTRKLQENAYNARRAACERVAAQLEKPSLRDVSLADLDRVQDPDDRAKARHVITEFDRVNAALRAIADADRQGLGALITACHNSLSSDYEVSTPTMDAMVGASLEQGALGARMTGAGFGGCIIILCDTGEADQINSAILAKFPTATNINQMDF